MFTATVVLALLIGAALAATALWFGLGLLLGGGRGRAKPRLIGLGLLLTGLAGAAAVYAFAPYVWACIKGYG